VRLELLAVLALRADAQLQKCPKLLRLHACLHAELHITAKIHIKYNTIHNTQFACQFPHPDAFMLAQADVCSECL
jgi:hypothetical protein